MEELFDLRQIESFIKVIYSVYDTGKSASLFEQPLQISLPDGSISEKYITTTYSALRASDGSVRGVISHLQDVTAFVKSRKDAAILADEVFSERENFRNLFRQTPEMVCVLQGPEHIFDFVNAAHIKALGFDATGMKVRVAQPESVEIHGILDEVYQTGVTADLIEIPVTVGVKLRYFNLTYAARKDKSGKPNGLMILGSEVTDQVEARLGIIKAREEAQESLEKLYTIVENLKEGLVFYSLEGELIYMNPEGLRIHGVSSVEELLSIIDKNVYELQNLEGEVIPLEAWPMNRLLKGEGFTDMEVVVRRIDKGDHFIASFSGIKVTDSNERPLLSVLSLRDITAKKNNEIDLTIALKTRDEFISIASHELKTPLTSLKMQLQMTKREIQSKKNPPPERLEKVFHTSLRQVDRLTSLVEDILDVSRIQNGALTYRSEKTALKPLIEDLIERFQISSESRISLDSPTDPIINCDPFRIDQVISNLVSNAIKYAGTDIRISIRDHAENVEIDVQDYGRGIPNDKISLIFNRFERVTDDKSITGLGLGLYISKTIIESHGGHISVKSSSTGTTFTVRLPH